MGSNRGFTIVEVMIALVLLSVGILAIARALPAGSRHSTEDRLRTQAIQFANERMEQIAASVLAGGALVPGVYGPESLRDPWSCTYRIEPLDEPLKDLSRVTVSVSWTTTRPDSVTLVTYLGL
jgi:prepilin-type N-terminal cleavage/methylation domain-containing protein